MTIIIIIIELIVDRKAKYVLRCTRILMFGGHFGPYSVHGSEL